MSYPLIIFGAGASYDCSSENPHKPISPLTKDLVNKPFLMPDLLEKYKGSGNLLGEIVQKVRTGQKTFEDVLTEIYKNITTTQEQKQFNALEFYLQEVFSRISDPNYILGNMSIEERREITQINNYKSILNRIDKYSNGKACIVTFNYESLFEDNLDREIENIKDYVSRDIKIFKVHGSHNWMYILRKQVYLKDEYDSFEICLKEPDILGKIKGDISHNPFHTSEIANASERDDFYKFPAIAIPLKDKDIFVCPPAHTRILEEELSKIDRVLIIGWKAGDELLLNMLKNKLSKESKILVVSNTLSGAEVIKEKIEKHTDLPDKNFKFIGGGFSEFINSEESNIFFK